MSEHPDRPNDGGDGVVPANALVGGRILVGGIMKCILCLLLNLLMVVTLSAQETITVKSSFHILTDKEIQEREYKINSRNWIVTLKKPGASIRLMEGKNLFEAMKDAESYLLANPDMECTIKLKSNE